MATWALIRNPLNPKPNPYPNPDLGPFTPGLSKQKMTTFVSGNMRGTLPWMAPELFFGDRNSPKVEGKDSCLVSNKVDVFSFGIVLWEIWQLGETPYSGLQVRRAV